MAKILITGGTGLIGSAICKLLLETGHTPALLSRREDKKNKIRHYQWDISRNYIDGDAFENVDYIIHLAGAGIAERRWTESYKKVILESRVKSSSVLFDFISKHNLKIKSLTGGSAMGYYGARTSEHLFTENDPSYPDFLGETCLQWEQSYAPFTELGIRTNIIRTGLVLSNEAGAYKTMAKQSKLGLGTAIGSGRQYVSWIHIYDIASIFIYTLLNESISGTFNGVASEPVSNSEFCRKLAQSLHKPFFLPNIPEFVLKLVMGESASMVTEGVKISNQKIKESGFEFKFDTLNEALKNLAGN